MIVEGNGGLFRRRNLISGLQQGVQTALCGGDAGEKSDDTAYGHNPDAHTEPGLKPEPQIQEEAEGKQNGQAELGYPQDHGQNFHSASRQSIIDQHNN